MKKRVTFDYIQAEQFFTERELEQMAPQVRKAHEMLHTGAGPGGEYTGWVEWPHVYDRGEYGRLKQVSAKIREKADAFVVIGVGGSYLGARAALEMLKPAFYNQLPRAQRGGPEIYFAGHQLSASYTAQLLRLLQDKEVYVNVISKSGTTLEPALAFRLFRAFLEKRYGKKEARNRIIATTDKARGALKQLADEEGYETFVVPDSIGGRYSVLTPVGLLPMAVAGLDTDQIMEGAADAVSLCSKSDIYANPSYLYAALRNLLYNKGKTIELFVGYEPSLLYMAEWWKQLFGESEGKGGKGLFPASLNFSTDLHSLGQYVQDGRRDLFATTLWIEGTRERVAVPEMENDLDGLNYLAGVTLDEINAKACAGAMLAHTEGGVPNLKVAVPEATPYYFGQLVYFFEKACGISGHLLGVNPFDQPGVEAYKRNMFRLLGKPSVT
ncbi:glucose-6-phosphate isomerase [Aneurinibacillus thermoaerophilus]|uniref:Glucose-6-phosphate isomerase n=1 Tax=Aneurinibacillus thermoaerophilus TaxID=143495 RepID=A0A1G7XT53_ANETH|nr:MULTISPECIES: glucose-6-phosphate isomerase [Aneurinibacillus]AMA73739.1 glucose-6-phosphate isomerase [Aneurinibacillus sp. XH2]MED0677091.1 glucose-6-phosphate isomerase [Aneurinibacillus thermoaerophilus]MED0756401.1 glucose-6-phosphate isomerase [Aneurinibacillus thermoaerophilus]MED0761200.1 glucose-6-phosphate isomerase [Aneurinibacillus thermoaerophilus]QYY43693.1 glucose-6-phosphate isomerase [Aneurinibacillus thermoaerophilus]